ncbi:hypothetical protein [Rhodococcus sp. YH1]|uniref:hypothetical protein n=1 Tax=Rhodococcus sp. YH1 TaxID=89066 RepID=UPI0013876344|nr:hypothetical protein [Rhodococcus sp. YH1]NCL78808.1 hypothetical protein [Rhodococcus sp. YH1]
MFVDRIDYWLTSEYRSWITDPNDPQVKQEREMQRRSGRRPPPMPLIPPVALRPADIAELRRRQYADAVAAHAPESGERKISSAADLKRLLVGR